MKYNQNKRKFRTFYAATAVTFLLTGFTSLAAEADTPDGIAGTANAAAVRGTDWNISETVSEIHTNAVLETKTAAEEAKEEYIRLEEEKRLEEERKAAEEAERLARQQAEQELLAALIFCEAGNQPYEGQVAVGAVVLNRVESGSFPDTISEVIYQSGQFTPAMTGWLDSVLASGGYTDSAMQAAADALAGSDPVSGCLYFSTGGGGYQLGDHFFR